MAMIYSTPHSHILAATSLDEMSELREKVAAIVSEADFDGDPWEVTCHRGAFRDLADRILAIPEIAEALKLRNAWLADQMPDLPQERVGELIRGLGKQ
jgi:hypothetical protein